MNVKIIPLMNIIREPSLPVNIGKFNYFIRKTFLHYQYEVEKWCCFKNNGLSISCFFHIILSTNK